MPSARSLMCRSQARLILGQLRLLKVLAPRPSRPSKGRLGLRLPACSRTITSMLFKGSGCCRFDQQQARGHQPLSHSPRASNLWVSQFSGVRTPSPPRLVCLQALTMSGVGTRCRGVRLRIHSGLMLGLRLPHNFHSPRMAHSLVVTARINGLVHAMWVEQWGNSVPLWAAKRAALKLCLALRCMVACSKIMQAAGNMAVVPRAMVQHQGLLGRLHRHKVATTMGLLRADSSRKMVVPSRLAEGGARSPLPPEMWMAMCHKVAPMPQLPQPPEGQGMRQMARQTIIGAEGVALGSAVTRMGLELGQRRLRLRLRQHHRRCDLSSCMGLRNHSRS